MVKGMCGGGVNMIPLLLQKICADPEAHRRVCRSYEMMLDFYGMKLRDPHTGLLIQCSRYTWYRTVKDNVLQIYSIFNYITKCMYNCFYMSVLISTCYYLGIL